MSTDRFGRDNSARKRHRGASLAPDESVQSGGASSSSGPTVGNVMLLEASAQKDLALFVEADAIFQQQQAEIGMLSPLANTQYQGTLPTAIDPTGSFRYTPYGSSASAADVATTFPDTVQVFPMNADDGVPTTHVNTTQEDYFPPNQEAYLPTTQVDSLFTPTQVQVTIPWPAAGQPVRPHTRRNAARKAVGRGRNRRARKKGPLRPRLRRPGRRRGTAPCLSGNRPGPAACPVRCPPGCRPANWEPDVTTTETNPSLTTSQSADLHSSNSSIFNPPSGLTEAADSHPSTTVPLEDLFSQEPSPISVVDYPNSCRVPLPVLEELREQSRGRPRAQPLGPRVPLPAHRQPRLPFRRVDCRAVDDRFVSQPYPKRPPQRVPARPMRQWSPLPQYRQIPIEQALNVRHEVVQIRPQDFIHKEFPDAGVAHGVLYQGPGHFDLTRYSRCSHFRRDFEHPVVNVSSGSSGR